MRIEIILSIIIFIVILLLYNSYQNHKLYNDFIEGLYISNDEFCNKADIDGMLIYIGNGNQHRKAYIIMYKDNAIIMNKKINIKFNNFIFSPFIKHKIIDKI